MKKEIINTKIAYSTTHPHAQWLSVQILSPAIHLFCLGIRTFSSPNDTRQPILHDPSTSATITHERTFPRTLRVCSSNPGAGQKIAGNSGKRCRTASQEGHRSLEKSPKGKAVVGAIAQPAIDKPI